MNKIFKNAAADIPASIVVFLVALPLCLGVAVASDAMPLSGLIAGITGGIVTGLFSKSNLSVSGPAAGLTAIVATSLQQLPSYEIFLLSVILAGILQIVLGYLKAGIIGDFIPNAVIKGMLAAIGIILILKQIPHFLGYDKDPEGDESFLQPDKKNTFTEIIDAFQHLSGGAIIIGMIALAILFIYETQWLKKRMISKILPGPLSVVVLGIFLNEFFKIYAPSLGVKNDQLVTIPIFHSSNEFIHHLPFPDWKGLLNTKMWTIALTIAVVASLESLLSIEAVDKLDPEKRLTPTNHELKAQGLGNIVSGLFGGLPVTSVIVRSSANVHAGAKSKMSTVIHGILLLVSMLFFPEVLNQIPLSALAAILIYTGYKLAKVALFREMYHKGWDQFLPFAITIVAIIMSDLLKGIAVGLLTGLFYVTRSNFKSAVFILKDEHRYLIRFRKEVSFLNKSYVKTNIEKIPDHAAVLIDATKSDFIDKDIIEEIDAFIVNASLRGIRVYIKKSQGRGKTFFNDITNNVIQ